MEEIFSGGDEFDGDLTQIPSSFIGSVEGRSKVDSVDSQFWEATQILGDQMGYWYWYLGYLSVPLSFSSQIKKYYGVSRLGHKLLFAHGIAKLHGIDI